MGHIFSRDDSNRDIGLQQARSMLENLTEAMSAGLVVVDRQYRVLHWNSWMQRHSGIHSEEATGKSLTDIFPDIARRELERYVSQCLYDGRTHVLSPLIHGHLVPLKAIYGSETRLMLQKVKIMPVFDREQIAGAQILIEDCTEQILFEREICNLNRTLDGLRTVNRLIPRVASSMELFEGVCRVLVDISGYSLVKAGLMIDSEPRCQWQYKTCSDIDLPETGLALQSIVNLESRLVMEAAESVEARVANDLPRYPLPGPFERELSKIGLRSACAHPIKQGKRIVGCFVVCSRFENIFGEEVVELLGELCQDLAFCMQSMDDRRKRLEAEAALIAEKERLDVTLRSIGDGVITADLNGDVVLVNSAAETMTGWKEAEAVGRPLEEVFEIVNEYTRKPGENPVRRVLREGRVVGLANHTVLIAKNGRERIIADSGVPIRDRVGNVIGVVLIFREITQRLEKEKRLQRASKLESIHTLSGGIAHEFNNILSVVLGNAELCMEDIPEGNPAQAMLREIFDASVRGKEVVRQLLSYSQEGRPVTKPLNLKSAVERIDKLIRAYVPGRIEIRYRFPLRLDPVMADESKVRQALVNLCNNAVKAMEEKGGRLSIALENVQVDSNHPAWSQKMSGYWKASESERYVCLSVEDTGDGIPPEHLDNIFDPFFTTRDVGEGSGMGLTVTRSIVRDHGGFITVESKTGKGTRISLFFPSLGEPETNR